MIYFLLRGLTPWGWLGIPAQEGLSTVRGRRPMGVAGSQEQSCCHLHIAIWLPPVLLLPVPGARGGDAVPQGRLLPGAGLGFCPCCRTEPSSVQQHFGSLRDVLNAQASVLERWVSFCRFLTNLTSNQKPAWRCEPPPVRHLGMLSVPAVTRRSCPGTTV